MTNDCRGVPVSSGKRPRASAGVAPASADPAREASEARSRERTRLVRLNKKLRNQVGDATTATIEIRDRWSEGLLGYSTYDCRGTGGQARVAVALCLAADEAQPAVRTFATLAETGARRPSSKPSRIVLDVAHEDGDGGVRQVVYAGPEEIALFLSVPHFRRAESLLPSQPRELSLSDLSILDHVRRFGVLPPDRATGGECSGLIGAGLLAPVSVDGLRLRLTRKGTEWFLRSAPRMGGGFHQRPVRHAAVGYAAAAHD